ncbi:uncharacterized protein LOC111085219 [Limulus polyphemus]|uniref:Uncharacterized protein LOC111085219 n=1 Tax=Limulus polyphemus TaxID=6850 RepID=A0ABM1S4E7_LIMPO|nr:uncharacterized protein LOC111085219 [Limulus polyphemus]
MICHSEKSKENLNLNLERINREVVGKGVTPPTVENKKRTATSVESGETNKTGVENPVPGRTEKAESVPRLHNKKIKSGTLIKISKDFGNFRQDSQTSSGSSGLSTSSKKALRNNQLSGYTSSYDHQGRHSWKRTQHQSSTSGHCSSTKVPDFKSSTKEISKQEKTKTQTSTSSSEVIHDLLDSLPSECGQRSWVTSVPADESSSELPDFNKNVDLRSEKIILLRTMNLEVITTMIEKKEKRRNILKTVKIPPRLSHTFM